MQGIHGCQALFCSQRISEAFLIWVQYLPLVDGSKHGQWTCHAQGNLKEPNKSTMINSGEVIHPVGFALFGGLRLMLRPPSSEVSSTWRSSQGRADGEGESQDLEDSQIREGEVLGSSPTESEVFGDSSPTENALSGANAEDSQIRESEVFGDSSPTESDLFGPQLCEDGRTVRRQSQPSLMIRRPWHTTLISWIMSWAPARAPKKGRPMWTLPFLPRMWWNGSAMSHSYNDWENTQWQVYCDGGQRGYPSQSHQMWELHLYIIMQAGRLEAPSPVAFECTDLARLTRSAHRENNGSSSNACLFLRDSCWFSEPLI